MYTPLSEDYKGMITNAVDAGVEYVTTNNNLKALIIGVSGGVDSALTAALARKVCDSTGIKLVGVCMPILGNKADEIDRAKLVGAEYCDKFSVVPLTEAFLGLTKFIDPQLCIELTKTRIQYVKPDARNYETPVEDKIRAGNIKARVRMIHLYNLASKHKGLVLSTDNYTEYLLGFWTIAGDIGDYGFIQKIWKTEVFGMADLIGGAAKLCADAVPTDGLGITNSDLDQLLPGWTEGHREGYRKVDDILIDYLENKTSKAFPENAVVKRHLASGFKRLIPISIPREILVG